MLCIKVRNALYFRSVLSSTRLMGRYSILASYIAMVAYTICKGAQIIRIFAPILDYA